MSWGGLNPALTAFRNAVNRRFPARGTQSDGGYADLAHGSTSQHQPDPDGTVDAFDLDVNLLGSTTPSGNPQERQLLEALKLDFEHDPHDRAQLWIHQREIANRDVDDWRERPYTLDNPHDKHAHCQSRQTREHDGRPWPLPRTDALLEEMFMPTTAEIVAALRPVIRAELDTQLAEQATAIRAATRAELAGQRDEAAAAVWAHRLVDPRAGAPATKPAGDYQRYTDIKHDDTRTVIADAAANTDQLVVQVLDRLPAAPLPTP